MERLEAGVTRRRAFDGAGGPRLYALYCAANPEWAAKAEALLERNAEVARWRKGANLRDRTHCKRGHLFSDENTLTFKRDYGRRYYRTCRLCAEERNKTYRMKPAQLAVVIDALRRNVRFERLKGIVDTRCFYRERELNPDFEAIVQKWLVGSRSRQLKSQTRTIDKRGYALVDAIVPKKHPPEMRMEIIIMIFEALGNRKYRSKPFWLHNMADSINHFVADYNKLNPTYAYDKIDSPWSLDASVSYDSHTKLIDTISQGLW